MAYIAQCSNELRASDDAFLKIKVDVIQDNCYNERDLELHLFMASR